MRTVVRRGNGVRVYLGRSWYSSYAGRSRERPWWIAVANMTGWVAFGVMGPHPPWMITTSPAPLHHEPQTGTRERGRGGMRGPARALAFGAAGPA